MKVKMMILLLAISFSSYSFADGQPEKILGFMTNKDGITFQVFSGGYTDKKDFSFLHNEANLPYGVQIQFSYAELGLKRGESFLLKNEIEKNIRTR